MYSYSHCFVIFTLSGFFILNSHMLFKQNCVRQLISLSTLLELKMHLVKGEARVLYGKAKLFRLVFIDLVLR